jgi:hypothetical protein
MRRCPDTPALSREDRENLRQLRQMNRQRMEDTRLKQQFQRLLHDLQLIQMALSKSNFKDL